MRLNTTTTKINKALIGTTSSEESARNYLGFKRQTTQAGLEEVRQIRMTGISL
jgi:hypothetical protein